MARSMSGSCRTETVVGRALRAPTLQPLGSEGNPLKVHLLVLVVMTRHPTKKKRADAALHDGPIRARGRPRGGEIVRTHGHLHGESDEEGGHIRIRGRLPCGGIAVEMNTPEGSGAHLHIMIVAEATRGDELTFHDLSFLPFPTSL